MKTDNLIGLTWRVVLGAVLGAILVPWTVSYWWPTKITSVKESEPTPNLHVTEVSVDVPFQQRFACVGGAIAGIIGGWLAANAARRRGGRV